MSDSLCTRCGTRPRAQVSVWCAVCQGQLAPTEEQLDDDARRRKVKRTKRLKTLASDDNT